MFWRYHPLSALIRLTWLAAGILGLAGLTGLLATATNSGQQAATLPAVLAVVGLLAAIQTAAVALVGEYVVRGYRETQGRPPYVIRQTIGGRAGVATSADTQRVRRHDAA